MKLEKKIIILTGAASGIGYEMLIQLAPIDCTIIAVDLLPDSIKFKSPNIHPYSCDLSVQSEIDKLFDFVLKKFGTIDIFIANAGFAYYEKISDANWNHIDKIFKVNTFSPIYTAEKMKEICRDRPFTVAVTASAMGFLPLPGYSLYSSTKAAIRGFGEAYRYELEKGQNFIVAFPIATKTHFFQEAGDSPVPFPCQEASVVAKRMINGIQKEKKEIFPSQFFLSILKMNGVLPFLLPLARHIEAVKFREWLTKRN